MKKIAIQTHPLKTNYGGILQAFALQYWLDSMGYDTIHLNRVFKADNNILKIKQIAYRLFYFKEKAVKDKVNSIFKSFINKHINLSVPLYSHKEWYNYIKNNSIDMLITGSDQVWRKEYTGAFFNEYFLNTKATNLNIKKVSYAASFGVDNIDQNYIDRIADLLHDFDAISVREDSGVKILKDNFNIDATHLIDPTMLLTADQYINIFNLKKEAKKPFVLAYVLDKNSEKQSIIAEVEEQLKIRTQFVYGAEVTKQTWRDKDIVNKPSIEQWLQSFYNAEFVVTDSFHGTVFAILFNKPFIAIANKNRGLTRFTSLLDLFNLSDRLVSELDDVELKRINHDIDFETINLIIEREQNKAKSFFDKNNNYE